MKLLPVFKSLLFIYVLLLIAFYLLQGKMIYHPTTDTPHSFEIIKITNNGTIIEALLTHPDKQQAIIYFGGNAENVIYSAADFEHHLAEHSTYLLKYRGYSGAAGTATEDNLYSDALALYDHVIEKHAEVTVIGRSLGSGVATYLATQRKVNKLILVTPFDSIQNVASDLLPFLPVKWFLRDKFDSKSRADKIQTETLVIVADDDRVIPKQRTESLIGAIPKEAHLKIVSLKAGHNDLDLNPNYFSTIKQFLHN